VAEGDLYGVRRRLHRRDPELSKLVLHRQRRRVSKDFEGKGHAQQMAAWTAFLRGEAQHPLPFEEARRSTLLALAAVEAIQFGRTVDIEA